VDDVTELMLLVIKQIPAGRVATYGQIANLAGKPNNARQVGATLRNLPSGSEVPWHRVVSARGVVSRRTQRSGCELAQSQRLEAEGVIFDERGRIDMQHYQWDPTAGAHR